MSTSRKTFLVLMMLWSAAALATGHGPVFGYATPVNSAGEWSFDAGFDARNFTSGTDAAIRSMFSYGFTPHVQWSMIIPGGGSRAADTPARTLGMGGWESDLAPRFPH